MRRAPALSALLALLLLGLPARADGPRRRRHRAPSHTSEPAALEPLIAIGTTPRKNVRLGFGYAGLTSPRAEVTASSFAFTTAYTFAPPTGDFSLDMKLPIGSVDGFLLGDIGFDFRWRALAAPSGTRVAIGFSFVLPSTLLNSLGGSNDEIALRRMSDRVYDELNLFPIRYWNMTPYFALSQRFGPLLLTADAGLDFVMASKERNRYEAPRPEFAVRYDLAASVLLHRQMASAILELGGLSWITDQSGDVKDGPLLDTGTGLTLALGARFVPDRHVALSAGIQVPLTGHEKVGVFDLSNLYYHDLSLVLEARFLLDS